MKPFRVFLTRLGVRDLAQPHVSPPLGLMYLAAHLRRQFDVQFRVVDQRLENCTTHELARMAAEFEPDLVGISAVTAAGYLIPELTAEIGPVLPNAPIVLGGPHASASRAEALTGNLADMVVVGEGELTFEEIARAVRDGARPGSDFSMIPGLVWRDRDGQVLTNPGVAPIVQDLDSLPMPAYDLIGLPRYWPLHSFVLIPRRKYVSVMSSRGCPFQCNYCHQIFGKRFRSHSPERIVDEIAHFSRTYGVRDIEFVDDVFNYDHDRVIETCDLLRGRDLKVKLAFPNGLRTDTLSEEIIEAMVGAGFYYASFALESGSPRIQKRIGKRLNVDSFLRNVEIATSRGVFGNGFAMLGFPTETEDEIRQTVAVMCKSAMHTAQFFTVTPFPGTPLHEEVARTMPEKLVGLDFADSTYGRIRVNLSAVPDEVLFGCQRQANRRFYLNPSRIYRLIRDHPAPYALAYYVPMFFEKITKGLSDGR